MLHRRFTVGLVLGLVLAVPCVQAASRGQEQSSFAIATSSFLGGSDYDDAVVGIGIQSKGTIVLAANLGSADLVKAKGGASIPADKHGCLVVLSPDGRNVLALRALAAEVKDLAMDAKDNIYVAAGSDGVMKLSPQGDRVLWTKAVGECLRVDAAGDGHVAVIASGKIVILDPTGRELGQAKGRHFTCDVCIDGASKTAIFCGFRNAKAWEGKRTYPVQICYIYGLAYDGTRKWVNYDWSTDRNSDRFLNKPTNNMADSRADRCAIGRDGKLYVTFQVAGGNHLFRYSPKDIMTKVKLVGGDAHHQFYNSRAEHKCFFARYEPATGEFLLGQQFCGRLSSGRANAVVTKNGNITADETGCVYVVGTSAYGIPLNLNPTSGDYRGGGFLLVMSPDFKTRLVCTRTADGKGSPHAVAARTIRGTVRAVYGGSGMPETMFVAHAVQPKAADRGEGKKDPKDGFFVVLGRK